MPPDLTDDPNRKWRELPPQSKFIMIVAFTGLAAVFISGCVAASYRLLEWGFGS